MAERPGILAVLAAVLCGCGSDQLNNGGGTELPGPIRVYVIKTESKGQDTNTAAARVLAREWRLWDLVAKDADSTTLESRGVLVDSQGIVTLPADSGTYLVEAWNRTSPPDSVDVLKRLPNSRIPTDDSCLNNLGRSDAPSSLRTCGEGVGSTPDAQRSPDILAMVRIPGKSRYSFRLLAWNNDDTLSLGEVRLWSFSRTDSVSVFKGLLRKDLVTQFELPRLEPDRYYAFEAWDNAGAAPNRVATRSHRVPSNEVLSSCAVQPADPLPKVLTLFECHLPPDRMSGGKNAPEHWGIVRYYTSPSF